MGLPYLPESLSDDTSASIGLACSPFAVTRYRDLTLGFSRRRLIPNRKDLGTALSQA
jgi:hypothetical protein